MFMGGDDVGEFRNILIQDMGMLMQKVGGYIAYFETLLKI